MSHEPKFNVGDLVQKHAGYRYPGIVRSRYAMPNGWRYDVEADHPDFKGMLHIFSGEQLELRPAAPPQADGVLDAATIERCAKIAEQWDGVDNVAAQIRRLAVTRPERGDPA